MGWVFDYIGFYRCPRCDARSFSFIGSLCRKCWFCMVRKTPQRHQIILIHPQGIYRWAETYFLNFTNLTSVTPTT